MREGEVREEAKDAGTGRGETAGDDGAGVVVRDGEEATRTYTLHRLFLRCLL